MKRHNIYLLLLSYVFFSAFDGSCNWWNKNVDIKSIKSDTENFITSIYTPSTNIDDAMLKVKKPENRNALKRYLEGKKIEKKDEKVVEFLDYAIQKQNIYDNSIVYNKFLNDVTSDKLYQDIQSQISVFMQQKRVQNFINEIQANSYNLFPNKKAIIKRGKWEDKNKITAKEKKYKENKEGNYNKKEQAIVKEERQEKIISKIKELNKGIDNRGNSFCGELENEIEVIIDDINCFVLHQYSDLEKVDISNDGRIDNIQIVNANFASLNLVNTYLYKGSSDNYERAKNEFLKSIKSTGQTYLIAYVEVKRDDNVVGYFIHCTEANSKKIEDITYGLFQRSEAIKIVILRCGSEIENMSSMFSICSSLTELDLSKFKTDNVKYMSSMFSGCRSLTNLNLSNFNTNKVIKMSGMFDGCSSLTVLNISNLKTNNVTDMSWMFHGCMSLTNLDLSALKTDNVTDMSYMFFNCTSLTNINLSNFNTSKVTNMSYMFQNCSSLTNLDLSNFNTNNVTNGNIKYMFEYCFKNKATLICKASTIKKITEEENSWLIIPNENDINNIINKLDNQIVYKFIIKSQDYGNKITKIEEYKLKKISNDDKIDEKQIVNKEFANLVNTYKYTGSSYNYEAAKKEFMDSIETTSDTYLIAYVEVGDAIKCFIHCTNANSIQDDYNYYGLFNGSEATKIVILSSGNNITDMSRMFFNCSGLTNLDLSNLKTNTVKDMRGMFNNCSSLKELNLSNFNTNKVTDMGYMFAYCSSLTNINLPNFNTNNVTDMSHMFHWCSSLTVLNLSSFNTNKVTKMYHMFYKCFQNNATLICKASTIKQIIAPIYNVCLTIPDKVKDKIEDNKIYKFSVERKGGKNDGNCSEIKGIEEIREDNKKEFKTYNDDKGQETNGENKIFNTNKDKKYSFIKEVDISNEGKIDDIQIVNANFAKENLVNAYKYTGNSSQDYEAANEFIKSIETTGQTYLSAYVEVEDNDKVTLRYFIHCKNANSKKVGWNVYGLFQESEATKIVIISCGNNIDNMSYMFSYCSSLTNLDLSNFNTKNVTNMSCMFYSCSSLTNLDLSSLDTDNVTNMECMFVNCSSLTELDLSNFNTNNVINMRGMFCQCSKLTNLDLSNFDTDNVTNMEGMFLGCSKLTILDLSSFNTNNVTNMSLMFSDCSSLTNLDLSNFNTYNVTNMRFMFAECSKLKVLFCNNFDISSNPSIGNIFQNTCISLLYLPGNVLNFFIKISKQHYEDQYIITCDYNFHKKSGENEKCKLADNKQNEKEYTHRCNQDNFINNVVYICDIRQEIIPKNNQFIKNVYNIKVFLRNWFGKNDNGREMLLKKVFIVMLLRNLYCSVCNNHGYNLLSKYTPKQDIMMCLHIISLIDRGYIDNTSYDKYLSMFLYMKLKSSLTYNLSYNNDIKEMIVKNNKSLPQENIKNEFQQGDMNIKINTYTGQNFTLQKESEDVFALRKYKIYNSYFCNEVYLSKVDNNEDLFSNNIKECLNIPEVDRGKGLLAFVVVDNEKYLVYCKNANSQQFSKNINNDTIQIRDSYYNQNHILNNTHNPQNNINIDNNAYNICGLFEGSEASDIYILIFGEGITNFANAFKDCVKLKKLDLTGIIYYMTILNITNIFYNAFVLGTASEIIANVGFMELNVDNNNIDIKKSSKHQVRNVLANNSAYTICKFLIERTYQDNGVNVYMGGYRFLNIISAQKNNETTCYLMSPDDLLQHASISDDAEDYVKITLPTKKKNCFALSYKTFNKEIQCKEYNLKTYSKGYCKDINNVFSQEFVKSRIGKIGYYNISADSIHYNKELEEKFYAKKCKITNEENNKSHILIFVKFNDNNVEKTYIIYCDDARYKGKKYGLFSGSKITSIVFLSCGEEIGSVKYMFCNCSNLTYADLSKLKIPGYCITSEMFLLCFDTKSECTLIIPEELEDSVEKELIPNFDIQKNKTESPNILQLSLKARNNQKQPNKENSKKENMKYKEDEDIDYEDYLYNIKTNFNHIINKSHVILSFNIRDNIKLKPCSENKNKLTNVIQNNFSSFTYYKKLTDDEINKLADKIHIISQSMNKESKIIKKNTHILALVEIDEEDKKEKEKKEEGKEEDKIEINKKTDKKNENEIKTDSNVENKNIIVGNRLKGINTNKANNDISNNSNNDIINLNLNNNNNDGDNKSPKNKTIKRYLIYCKNGNSIEVNGEIYGLFQKSKVKKIKILSCGYGITNMSNMFKDCGNLRVLDLNMLISYNVTDMSHMFSWCSSLTSLDLSNLDTKNVTNMEGMFSGCRSLKELDLSNFNTENVTSMNSMFSMCSGLTKLDLSNFNIKNITDIYNMFAGWDGRDLDIICSFRVQPYFAELGYIKQNNDDDNINNNNDYDTINTDSGKDIYTYIWQSNNVYGNSLFHFQFNNLKNENSKYISSDVCSVTLCMNPSGVLKIKHNRSKKNIEMKLCPQSDTCEITIDNTIFKLEDVSYTLKEKYRDNIQAIINNDYLREYDSAIYIKQLYNYDYDTIKRYLYDYVLCINGDCQEYILAIITVKTDNKYSKYLVYCDKAYYNVQKSLFGCFKDIKNIDVISYGCDIVDDKIIMIFNNLTSLKKLDLSLCNMYVTPKTYLSIIHNCTSLIDFKFNYNSLPTNYDIFQVFEVNNNINNNAALMGETYINIKLTGGILKEILNNNATQNVNDSLNVDPVVEQKIYLNTNYQNDKIYSLAISFSKKNLNVHKNTIQNSLDTECSNITILKKQDIVMIGDKIQLTPINHSQNFIVKYHTMDTYVFKLTHDDIINNNTIDDIIVDNIVSISKNYILALVTIGKEKYLIYCDNANSRMSNSCYYGLFQESKATKIVILSCGSEIENMINMFNDCQNLTELDLSKLKTYKVKDMSYMFSGCKLVKSLKLSNFNTLQVIYMYHMFSECNKLEKLDLSSWNTSNVKDMSYMFDGCASLIELDLSSFNTQNVTDMSYMFNNCQSLTILDLFNFNTSKVTNMSNMFSECSKLTELNLVHFMINNINIENMFYNCFKKKSEIKIICNIGVLKRLQYVFKLLNNNPVNDINFTSMLQSIPINSFNTTQPIMFTFYNKGISTNVTGDIFDNYKCNVIAPKAKKYYNIGDILSHQNFTTNILPYYNLVPWFKTYSLDNYFLSPYSLQKI